MARDHEFENRKEWQSSAPSRARTAKSGIRSIVTAREILLSQPPHANNIRFMTDEDGMTSVNFDAPVFAAGENAAAGGPLYPGTSDQSVLADQFAHFAQNWHGFSEERRRVDRKKQRRQRRTAAGESDGSSSEDEKEIEGPEGFLYPENDGDDMHRQGEAPTDIHELPVRRTPVLDNLFFGQGCLNIKNIADKSNTHISMPTFEDRGSTTKLEIWGLPEDVKFAKYLLTYLYIHVDKELQLREKEKKRNPWATVKAGIIGRKRDHLNKLHLEEQNNARFKMLPLSNQFFQAWGVFHIPPREVNVQSILGMNYEALDEIRFDCECYITYSAKRSAFRIQGDDSRKVEQAIDRIFNCFSEIAMRNRKPIKMNLVVPPYNASRTSEVSMTKHHGLNNMQVTVKRGNQGVLCKLVTSTVEHDSTWPALRIQHQQANEAYLRKAVGQVLQDLYYNRGYAKFRIYFGTLLLFQYKRAKNERHNITEFFHMMHEAQATGEVIRYIGNSDVGEELIKHCGRVQEIFTPVNRNILQDESIINKSEPAYSASFSIVLNNGQGVNINTKLDVTFEKLQGSNQYRAVTQNWLKVPKPTETRDPIWMSRKAPLEVKVLDLENELAYQFDVTTAGKLAESDEFPLFKEFVLRLRLDLIPDESVTGVEKARDKPTIHRVSYINLPGMTVDSVVQKQKYQYWVNGTSYIFEVTKYEYLDTASISQQYKEGSLTNFRMVKPEVRYGASLFHATWDTAIGSTRNLRRGLVGDWKPDLDDFFVNSKSAGFGSNGGKPHDSEDPENVEDGFSELLGRIDACVQMIKSIRTRVAKRTEKKKNKDLRDAEEIMGAMERQQQQQQQKENEASRDSSRMSMSESSNGSVLGYSSQHKGKGRLIDDYDGNDDALYTNDAQTSAGPGQRQSSDII